MTNKLSHSIDPVYNDKSRILILGSFPSVKSREGQFFYHHPQNRFWKVLAAVFDSKVPESIEEKRQFLINNRIAVWDVIKSCEITGSSDSSIRNVTVNNLSLILDKAQIERIYVNGGTAYRLYKKYCEKELGQKAYPLPSTSPANAAWSLERLIEVWREIVLFSI